MIRVPETFPRVPDDFTGECYLEVEPDSRSGRGRWWRPNGNGYTDVLTEAGVYDAAGARRRGGDGHSYPIDARAAYTVCLNALFEALTGTRPGLSLRGLRELPTPSLVAATCSLPDLALEDWRCGDRSGALRWLRVEGPAYLAELSRRIDAGEGSPSPDALRAVGVVLRG